jgi:hypothetical protein
MTLVHANSTNSGSGVTRYSRTEIKILLEELGKRNQFLGDWKEVKGTRKCRKKNVHEYLTSMSFETEYPVQVRC